MKLRSIFLSFVAAVGLVTFTTSATQAQNYPNPSAQDTEAARRGGPCRDPWVSIAVRQVAGKTPQGVGDFGDCNIKLYNGGSWSSYNELAQAVKLSQSNMSQGRLGYQLIGGNRSATLNLYYDSKVVEAKTLRLIGSNDAIEETSNRGALVNVLPGVMQDNVRFLPCTGGGVPETVDVNLGKHMLRVVIFRPCNR